MLSILKAAFRSFVSKSAYSKAIRALPDILDEIVAVSDSSMVLRLEDVEYPQEIDVGSYDVIDVFTDDLTVNTQFYLSGTGVVSGHRVRVSWFSNENSEGSLTLLCDGAERPAVYDITGSYVYPNLGFRTPGDFFVLEFRESNNSWSIIDHNIFQSNDIFPIVPDGNAYRVVPPITDDGVVDISIFHRNAYFFLSSALDGGNGTIDIGNGAFPGDRRTLAYGFGDTDDTVLIGNENIYFGGELIGPISFNQGFQIIQFEWNISLDGWVITDHSFLG